VTPRPFYSHAGQRVDGRHRCPSRPGSVVELASGRFRIAAREVSLMRTAITDVFAVHDLASHFLD